MDRSQPGPQTAQEQRWRTQHLTRSCATPETAAEPAPGPAAAQVRCAIPHGGSSALWNPKQPLAHDLLLCNTTQQSFWGHSSPSGSCSTGTSPQLVKCFASLELYHCASPTLSRPLHAYIERPRRMPPAAALQQGAQRARLWRPGWAVAGRQGPAMGRATSTARLSLRPGSARSLCAVCPLWAR